MLGRPVAKRNHAAGRGVDSESIFKAIKGEVTTGFYCKTDFEATQSEKKKKLGNNSNGSTSALLLNRYLRNSFEETCISLRWPTGSCSLSAKKNTDGKCSVWARFHFTLALFLFGSETFLPGGVWPSHCTNVQQVKVHTVSHTPPLTHWTAHSVELAWLICSIQPHKVV